MFQAKDVEEIKTHILLSMTFFENSAVYETMWKNTVEPGRAQMIIWRMCTACWIPKDRTNNHHTEYLLLFRYHNGCTNAPECYVIRTLSVLFPHYLINDTILKKSY